MRKHPRRASVDPTSPRAWGTSDRSGFVGTQRNMRWQWEWRGTGLANTRVLVHPDELDVPQRQLGTIFIPPDPLPIINARPEQYNIDEWPVSTRYTTDGRIRAIAGVVHGTGAANVIERIVAVQGNLSASDRANVR